MRALLPQEAESFVSSCTQAQTMMRGFMLENADAPSTG